MFNNWLFLAFGNSNDGTVGMFTLYQTIFCIKSYLSDLLKHYSSLLLMSTCVLPPLNRHKIGIPYSEEFKSRYLLLKVRIPTCVPFF